MYLVGREERHEKAVRDWLLAILRFALTLEDADRAVVLAMAEEMDRAGSRPDQTAFTFFVKMSGEFCNAIADRDDPKRAAVLRRHLGRIDDPRLRRTLETATEFYQRSQAATNSSKARQCKREDLWKGLRRK